MNTQRYLSINNSNTSKSIEKLSSGYRINRAGDDAAGLAISEKMRAQIRGLDMAAKNSQDAISLIQTAEGALTETHAILQRMSELAVQSASDTNQDSVDREALNQEFTELKNEIDDISSTTKFNGKTLLDGSFGGTPTTDMGTVITDTTFEGVKVSEQAKAGTYSIYADGTAETVTITDGTTTQTLAIADKAQPLNFSTFGIEIDLNNSFLISDAETVFGTSASATSFDITAAGAAAIFQTGASQGDELSLSIANMSTTGLSIDTASVDNRANAQSAISSVNGALNSVSTERAKLGAYQNRLEHKINSLSISAENLQAAESRIRDVDMAKEMMEFTKNNILTQAATAMLAQANQSPQTVLQLLR